MYHEYAYLNPSLQGLLADDRPYYHELLKRPKSLGDLLPYDEYLPNERIFINKDGSLGVMFEVDLLEHEPMVAQDVVSAVSSLRSWFSLPENCVLQVIFEQSRISPRDERFAGYIKEFDKAHPVSDLLFKRRIEEIRKRCEKEDMDAPLERRAFVTIRYFPKHKMKRAGFDLLKRRETTLVKTLSAYQKDLNEFKHIASDFERNSRIGLKRVDADGLLTSLRRFFNPNTFYNRDFAAFNPSYPLSKQILYASPSLDFKGIEREGSITRTLTLKTSPQWAYPGGMAYLTRLSFPFRVALNFSFPPRAKVKQFFDVKEFFLQNTPSARARRARAVVAK